MEGLTITGIKDLTKEEQDTTKELVQKHYEKLEHHFGDDIKVSFVLKPHNLNKDNDEKRHSYSIELKVEAKSKMFRSDKNHGFEIHTVIKNAFDDIETEIKKKFDMA